MWKIFSISMQKWPSIREFEDIESDKDQKKKIIK